MEDQSTQAVLDKNSPIIKDKQEIAKTLKGRLASSRGLFSNRVQVLLTLLLIGFACLRMWWLAIMIATVLLADFLAYVVSRAKMLSHWNAGKPRLTTAHDFHAVDDAFRAQNLPTPTMGDYENAMGFSKMPEWRTALRYQELARFYQDGVVADIGCGDGRLCWRYHICPPENYYGVDAAGLVKILSDQTSGRAHAIAGVAESTGLPSESVDLLVCTEVFEHLTDPAHALQEFCRVVKSGGQIVIQSPSARRLRNLNLFHVAVTFLGRWFPSILQRTMVHENTFIGAFTYHWDFTQQDFQHYVQGLPLKIESWHSATYKFNPNGNSLHRLAYRVARLPVINSVWGDLTVVLRKA